MKRIKQLVAAAALTAAAAGQSQAAFTLTTISPANWGAADTVLGVAGYTIENFEDTTLIAGLQIGWTAPSGTVAPSGTLPTTFDPRPTILGGDDGFANGVAAFYNFPCGSGDCTSVWDGTKALINGSGNKSYEYSSSADWSDLDLVFTNTTTSVGFSLQQNNLAVNVQINGNEATLSIPAADNGGRFGYVVINATGGDVISSIRLGHASNDAWVIDHLAIAAVPEPETYALMAIGLALVGGIARRQRR